MHVSLKKIQMLTTFDKYNLLLSIYILIYVIKEINLLFFKYVQMFCHKSKGKGKKGKSSSSSQACSGTSTNLFVIMVLLNFYLHVLIHYYVIASQLIYFIIVFVCRPLRPPDTNRRNFLGLCMTRASRRWLEHGRRFPRFPRSRRSTRPSRRLLKSRRSERPSRRLPRS
jgi:hypothetical protein